MNRNYPWVHYTYIYTFQVRMLLQDLVKRLNLLCPLQLAEKWDNVGLLLEPCLNHKVDKILLTNDLTNVVLEEAIADNCGAIISYHPPLFRPFNRLTQSAWKQQLAVNAIRSNIAIFSPHTSWDSVSWMNNKFIIRSVFGAVDSLLPAKACWRPIMPTVASLPSILSENTFSGLQIGGVASETIYSVLCNSSITNPTGFVQLKLSDANELQVVSSFDVKDKLQLRPSTVSALDTQEIYGYGLFVTVKVNFTEQEALQNLKHFLQLRYLRYSAGVGRKLDSPVRSFAVCCGSGGEVFKSVSSSCDLLITGEMSHHEVLDAQQRGISVILTEHSNSERGFITHMKTTLEKLKLLEDVQVVVSKVDSDPLDIF